jgi:V8-like Glu-specific endopeptidase
VSTVTQPIVGGTADYGGDEAVVALVASGRVFCTGTLVSPRVVVTAAHCVDPDANVPFASITVEFGSSIGNPWAQITVMDGLVHPQWSRTAGYPNDIALLLLGSPAPIPPVPMNTQAFDSSLNGTSVRLVGFGSTSAALNGLGTKRQATTHLTSYDATTFHYDSSPGQTCLGDSGGPAFISIGGTEQYVGITSNGDTTCSSYGIDTRIDAYVTSFVQPYITANDSAGTCNADGYCLLCSPDPDPDCVDHCGADGVCKTDCARPDVDCTPSCAAGNGCVAGCLPKDPDCDDQSMVGDVCVADASCVSNLCITGPDGVHDYCSRPCTQDSECPMGVLGVQMLCRSETLPGGMAKVCAYVGSSPGGVGWPCDTGAAAPCPDGFCEVQSAEVSICTRACSAAQACPSGFSCVTDAVNQQVCLPAAGGCAISRPRPGRPGRPGWLVPTALLLLLSGLRYNPRACRRRSGS